MALLTLACAGLPLCAAPFGPGQVGLVAQGGSGADTTLDGAAEEFSIRFTAQKTGALTDFSFASNASRGFANKDPKAFAAELYADAAGKPGTSLGAATGIAFNDGGGRARSAQFAGVNVTAGQVYHVVIRSNPANPASAAKNFSIGAYNLARPETPRLDSFDMSTANPAAGFLRSADGGASWTEVPNTVAAHTVTIGGAKQGWGYNANSDDLNTFKTAAQAQYIAQGFTYHGAGDAGWIALGLRPQNGLANQELKVVFRIARAADFSVMAEKTATVHFGPAAIAKTIAMDFSGTALKDGENYVFFAGLADDVSQSPDDYLFVRAYNALLGAPGLDYSWQGSGTAKGGSRAWFSADMKTLSPTGLHGAAPRTVGDQVDIGLILGAPASLAQEATRAAAAVKPAAALSQRTLKICVAADAPPAIRAAAQSLIAAAATQPLLAAMAGGAVVGAVTDAKAVLDAPLKDRAFSHLVLVGLPTDPLIKAAWQQEATIEQGGLYAFGWGNLQGDVGYIESDRNPFMHSAGIASAPYETEVVTLTGTTPAGVALAVDAFLKRGLVNGIVAAPGWKRPQTTILDQDPLTPAFAGPAGLPATAGDAPLVGITAGGEDEYRGVLEDTGVRPAQIWRAKYLPKGAWDGAGAASAFDAYSAGLHRRAYGNTLWIASFASAQEAAAAAPKIAAAAKLNASGPFWTGNQPLYANGNYAGERPSSGGLRLWQQGNQVLMSTLSIASTNAVVAKMKAGAGQ